MSDNKKITHPYSRYLLSKENLRTFVQLIEQADSTSRNKILDEVKKELPELYNVIMEQVIFFDELLYLDDSILEQFVPKLSPKILTYALVGCSTQLRDTLLQYLDFKQVRAVKDEEKDLPTKPDITVANGARKQIMRLIRSLESDGAFVLELHDCPRLLELKKRSAA